MYSCTRSITSLPVWKLSVSFFARFWKILSFVFLEFTSSIHELLKEDSVFRQFCKPFLHWTRQGGAPQGLGKTGETLLHSCFPGKRFISGFTITKQRLLGRKVGKMADDSEQEVTESISLDHEGLWKGKYFTLLKNCRQIEQVRLCSLRICQPPSEEGTLKVFWITKIDVLSGEREIGESNLSR